MKFFGLICAVLVSSSAFAMSRTERNFRAMDVLFKSDRVLEMENTAMLSSIEILGSDASKVTLRLTYFTGMSADETCQITQFVVQPETENIMLGRVQSDNCPQK